MEHAAEGVRGLLLVVAMDDLLLLSGVVVAWRKFSGIGIYIIHV
jgi:hypothetical protein